MLENTESPDLKISKILHFIANEEESESNIAKFKELLLGLGDIVPEVKIGFKRSQFMTLVGFCFWQQELKQKFVDCILEFSPDLLAGLGSFKTLKYTYDLTDKGENGYSLQAISPWECWHLCIAPLFIAATGDEGLSKVKLILEHDKYLEDVKTDAGYKTFVNSYILTIENFIGREDTHEILETLHAESERLAISLGEQGNMSLLNECLKMVHYKLEEIDNAEACQKIYDEISAVIHNFEKGYTSASFMKIISNNVWFLNLKNILRTHQEFCAKLLPQRTLENQVFNILDFIQREGETEENVAKFENMLECLNTMLKGFNCGIADIVLRDMGMFYSLAGFCVCEDTQFKLKFKPKFLNCILDVSPDLLMSEKCIFKYPSFMNYGPHPWGVWERIRLIEDPVWFQDGEYYSPLIKAVISKDLLRVTTILEHPIIADRAATHRWEVLEWKIKYYVMACPFIWKEQDASCAKILEAFKFAEMLKEVKCLGVAGEQKIFENIQRFFYQSIEEESAVKDRIVAEIMHPAREAFETGILIRNNPQATLLLMINNSRKRGCETAGTALITASSCAEGTNKKNASLDNTASIDETEVPSTLQYIGGALIVGLGGYVILKYFSKDDMDIGLHH
ncbi:MAG: hypothetical protein K0R73_1287 [Candidatus Midichloriaceae bacterium]|jgi:hypothetical protein|nr:hypothetical protein [Candidatus Midichloriaceae bacterium]